MSAKKIILPIVKASGLIVLVLLAVLVAHIATAKPVRYDNATLQISRIDFTAAPLDAQTVRQIKRDLKSIPGVKSERLDPKTGVLIYFHDNRLADSRQVYETLISKGNYPAKRFTVSDEIARKKVCPAMPQDGFAYHFTKGIKRIFNN